MTKGNLENQLWKELLNCDNLRRGWHLCRTEIYRDFAEDLFSVQVCALDLKNLLQEISNRLETGSYRPDPLFHVEVPKGILGFRPGSVISIKDRIVLCTIILLLAQKLDAQLPKGVWSFRLVNPIPKKGPIFKEQKLADLPFLKKKTIRRLVDPFESWYSAWPGFDKESRRQYEVHGMGYMATSDIAAYFENIQIPILRDFLVNKLNGEQRVVNLLCLFLETWALTTPDGRGRLRGIPQGSMVTSFLGNIFLLPLDEALMKLENEGKIKYFRYQDDVRIFAKSYNDARKSIFVLTRTLRALHLNVQTAKTRIYSEFPDKEISRFHTDIRIDRVNELIDEISKAPSTKPIKAKTEKKLNAIAKIRVQSTQKILNSSRPLEGLSMRFFLRWVYAHILIESPACIRPLLNEIERNTDPRLLRKLESLIKTFPRHSSITNKLTELITKKKFGFDYQVAECFRVMRYASRIPNEAYIQARKYLYHDSSDPYLKMQSAYLLARTKRLPSELQKMRKTFNEEKDDYVQVALGLITVQSAPNQPIIRDLVLHQNEKVRQLGKFYRILKNDPTQANIALNAIFQEKYPWVACDRMPILFAISQSKEKLILEKLHHYFSKNFVKNHQLMDIRETCLQLDEIIIKNLKLNFKD